MDGEVALGEGAVGETNLGSFLRQHRRRNALLARALRKAKPGHLMIFEKRG
jgi:hypothetical protein